jgi:hypothetical protein
MRHGSCEKLVVLRARKKGSVFPAESAAPPGLCPAERNGPPDERPSFRPDAVLRAALPERVGLPPATAMHFAMVGSPHSPVGRLIRQIAAISSLVVPIRPFVLMSMVRHLEDSHVTVPSDESDAPAVRMNLGWAAAQRPVAILVPTTGFDRDAAPGSIDVRVSWPSYGIACLTCRLGCATGSQGLAWEPNASKTPPPRARGGGSLQDDAVPGRSPGPRNAVDRIAPRPPIDARADRGSDFPASRSRALPD